MSVNRHGFKRNTSRTFLMVLAILAVALGFPATVSPGAVPVTATKGNWSGKCCRRTGTWICESNRIRRRLQWLSRGKV